MSDLIASLDPDVQDLALDLLQRAKQDQIVLRVTQAKRTLDEQAKIYAQGRSTPGPIVTYAPPGYSWHNFGRAFDIAIVYYPGDLTPTNLYDGNWEKIGDMGEELGLIWGGRWKHPDRPHFEHHGDTTLAALRLKARDEGLLV